MHPKFTLAILIIGISAVAKGQTGRPDSAKTSGKELLTTYQQGHVYDMTIVNDKMTALLVDNKRIEPADFHLYDSVLNAIKAEMKEDNDRASEERAEQKRDWEQAQRDQEQAGRDREQAVRDRAQGEQDRKQAEHDQEQAVRDREQGDRDREQGQKDREQGEREREQDQQQARRDQQQAVKDREQGERDREQGQRDREQGERDREAAKEERRQMRNIIRELVDEKIIPDAQSLNSMVLTETAFIVNGTKQPQQVLLKFKEKYPSFVHAGLTYGDCDCQTEGTAIHFSGQYPAN
jgi:colicin import membrane protein